VQLEVGVLNVRVLVNVVDPLGIEGAGAALDAVHHVAFFKQELRKVGPVLAGDTGDQGNFGSSTVAGVWHRASNGASINKGRSGF